LAPVAVGHALRQHRDRAGQAVRLARAEDRARTAREVHDAVGHHLTAIHLQARAVRRVTRDLPPAADHALGSIADSSAAALAEVRDVLRDHGATLADLPALAERAGATLTHHDPRPLPARVDHAAYRVAQEALTNALRHSDATHVHIDVRHTAEGVTITVEDNGSTTPTTEVPRTLHARVRELGGTLRVTPNTPTGWRVRAGLPT
ncbi:MAG: sensor histidine kinase, partial [Saccharothrix sp.]|nr:sensor histidine kinase [Saccharothrix sp.]